MFPYWGDKELGNRAANNYVPQLVGTLFYKALGRHPVEVNGRSVSDLGAPKFVGYDLVKKQPVFITRFGGQTIRTRVQPLGQELGLKIEITAEPAGALSYRTEDNGLNVKQEKGANGALIVTIVGRPMASFAGYPRRTNFTEASVAAGDTLSKNYGCVVCHSSDGSPGHGPTWAGLFEKERPLIDGSMVKADEAYLYESIKVPNAKIAQTFPPNFMPAYTMLKPIEVDSLVMYIKSLKQPE
jgi:cytochrome c2